MNPEHNGSHLNSRSYAWPTSVLCALLLVPALAYALPDDSSQPIHIQSDRAQLDQRKGLTTYEGDVQLEQGSMKINADRITIHTDANNQVQKIVATGKPARLQQQPDATRAIVNASAETIDYNLGREQLLLLSNAHLEQGGATMTGNRINYDIVQDIVNVSGEAGTEQPRIQMVIPPQNQDTKQD